LGSNRPQAIVLAAAEEKAIRTVDLAQLAKALLLAEEGDVLVIEGCNARPELASQIEAIPGKHPRFQGTGGGELSDRILCTQNKRIGFLPLGNLEQNAKQAVDPLLIARCKRHYALILIDVGQSKAEAAQSLIAQSDFGILSAILSHTPRERAAQSAMALRHAGLRMLSSVLCEPLAKT
jgi:hypothetical protein